MRHLNAAGDAEWLAATCDVKHCQTLRLGMMTSEYIMNTDRLRKFLDSAYEDVIRYTIADAFADSFKA